MTRSENCSEDFVQVLDHNLKTLQKLCGRILYPKGLTSGSSLIRVSLQANGLTNYREYGFEAWWTARNKGKVNQSLAFKKNNCMFYQILYAQCSSFPHRPGVVYNHLLLRQETRIPGFAPFSF